MKVSRSRLAFASGLVFLCMGFVGCVSFLHSRLASDPRSGAMEYVEKLKGKGDLPGFADSELGDFSMDAGKIILGVGVTYPLTVTISASKTAKNVSWYCYELSKQNSNEEWRLVNAWQDKEGQWISLPRTPVGKFRSQQLTNEMTR